MADPIAVGAADFVSFFEELTGHEPFPWQRRLAERVLSEGWPALLDLPTGTGKTAAIDIAVFALAARAGGTEGPNAPRRIVYVVDRRTIVDQAHRRAVELEDKLAAAPEGSVLARVAAALRLHTGGQGPPLQTALLRGGIPRDNEWARRPDQPLVVVSTVDQVGSRLLFRGYGVSRSMRPVHAGLLGADCLYLLDEVHLSQPFRETLQRIAQRYQDWAQAPVAPRIRVVEMSATPGEPGEGGVRFGLDDDDRAHPVLRRRLETRKPTTLLASDAKRLVRDLVAQATTHATDGRLVAVVVNRVATAREVARALDGKVPKLSLVTGRMRPVDRHELERGLDERIRVGTRDRSEAAVAEVVVATQCIEAGADFDFDVVISECASFDALRQRFGRLDRVGDYQRARGVVVGVKQALADDPVYGESIGKTWQWLGELAAAAHAESGEEGVVDFGLGGLPEPPLDLLAPRPPAPVLLPSHLDTWAQTSDEPSPDPEVALWLHGPETRLADVQVAWRADLDPGELQEAADEGGDANKPGPALARVLGIVELLPPATGEVLAVPFAAAKAWLAGAGETDVADVEGGRSAADEGVTELAGRPCLVWLGEGSSVAYAEGLRPGDTVVVPSGYGGISRGTWDPTALEPVTDVAERAALTQRGRGVLRLHPSVLATLFPGLTAPPPRPSDSEERAASDRELVVAWLDDCARCFVDGGVELPALIRYLRGEAKRLVVSRIDARGPENPGWFVIAGRRPFAGDLDADTDGDQGAFLGFAVTLAAHLAGVERWASDFAAATGLLGPRAGDLATAARFHDIGKHDPRCQRFLHGGSEYKALVATEAVAKSAGLMGPLARQRARERSGYPRGARHELLSVALLERAPAAVFGDGADPELVLHLVGAHHGHCRPFAPVVPDPEPVEVSVDIAGGVAKAASNHGLERLDSGVSQRFWRLTRRYGWWGLAWLEVLLRLADHRQSEAEVKEANR